MANGAGPTVMHVAETLQRSCFAGHLPLELQHQILSYLDEQAFHAARQVCRWWRLATVNSHVLRRVLARLPIRCDDIATISNKHVVKKDLNPFDLEAIFDEAVTNLLLNIRVTRRDETSRFLAQPNALESYQASQAFSNLCDDRTIILRKAEITLLDTSNSDLAVLARRELLFHRKTAFGSLRLAHDISFSSGLALSNSGNLLAVATGKTVRVYDLAAADNQSDPLHFYVESESMIYSLDFEHDDHVLRVKLAEKSSVVYLGQLGKDPINDEKNKFATIEHWKEVASSANAVLLDSTHLRLLTLDSNDNVLCTDVISSMQLLREFENGYVIAGRSTASKQGSHYFLGYVFNDTVHNSLSVKSSSSSSPSSTLTQSKSHSLRAVLNFTPLESFLSSLPYYSNSTDGTVDCAYALKLWDTMPSGHEQHVHFQLSSDAKFLALAERAKKNIHAETQTQIFVYRVASSERALVIKAAKCENPMRNWEHEARRQCQNNENESLRAFHEIQRSASDMLPRIPRIPICVGTIQGEAQGLGFVTSLEGDLLLRAVASRATYTWKLEHW